MYHNIVNFDILVGKTLKDIRVIKDTEDRIYFDVDDDTVYMMYHRQDCCESVNIEEIIGDLSDLIGNPILLSEEVSDSYNSSSQFPDNHAPRSEYEESWTWTFYKLSTIKGSVTIRWYGSSNGYYSESVSFVE